MDEVDNVSPMMRVDTTRVAPAEKNKSARDGLEHSSGLVRWWVRALTTPAS